MRIPITARWTTVKVFPLVLYIAMVTHPLHAVSGRTFGTAGKEKRVLKAGVEADLFRYTGKGFVTNSWLWEISRITGSHESACMWIASEKHPSIWN
jgi:hypothetical protein